jgi:hypothetical protein
MRDGGPGTRHDIEDVEVTTRGWHLTATGRNHTIELGAIAPLHDSPDAIFLDDDLLVAVPALEEGEPWAHHFALDGCLVSLETVRHAGEPQLDFDLSVDGVDQGPPGTIVGMPFRPAIGTPARRLRDRGIVAITVFMIGLTAGVLVPIVGGWEADDAWPSLVILLAVFAVVSLIAVAVSRDRRPWMPVPERLRKAAWAIVPLDLGVIVGAALTTVLMTGSVALDRAVLINDVGMIAVALFALSLGTVTMAGIVRRPESGIRSFALSSTSVSAIGFLCFGAGLLLVAIRLLGLDSQVARPDDLTYQVGMALTVAGVIAVKFRKVFDA